MIFGLSNQKDHEWSRFDGVEKMSSVLHVTFEVSDIQLEMSNRQLAIKSSLGLVCKFGTHKHRDSI